ncbi:VOC family protein [Methylobacterium nigriterrae]|uniref:VOC family protein n=1 Tax=Methylobacterium nigriterrae TaxID=3127512 RepID=UPI003013A36D
MAEVAKGFVWYELMTTDVAAAEAFYRAVVGWEAEEAGGPGRPYRVMRAGEARVAGLMPLPEDARAGGLPPVWVGYIGTADVDAEAEAVARAGGAVHRAPADIPGIGRFAVVTDPQGALFTLFTPRGEVPAPVPAGTPGHVGWHELYAADWPAAFAFYAERFGWTKAESIDLGPMGTYQLFAAGGVPVGGMMNKFPSQPTPSWQFYINVVEIEAAAARVREAGGTVLMEPHQVPGGSWILQGRDPQGAAFALVAAPRA